MNVSVKGGIHILVTFEDVFEPLFLFFHLLPCKDLSPSLVGGLPLGKFRFLHFVVLVFTVFSNSLLPPAARISVRTVFPQIFCQSLGGRLGCCFCS